MRDGRHSVHLVRIALQSLNSASRGLTWGDHGMRRLKTQTTGRERTFDPDEIIVSKTNPAGVITYANEVFVKVSGFTEAELLGAPHNLIRHPDMPRCVFQFLWDRLGAGHEVFAYVVNQARNGDHYWVLAHVTPTFDASGEIIGYHSSRRVPSRSAIGTAAGLYKTLRGIELAHDDSDEGMAAAMAALVGTLQQAGVDYDEFAFSL